MVGIQQLMCQNYNKTRRFGFFQNQFLIKHAILKNATINLSKDKEEEKYNFQLLFKKDQIENDITANYNVMIENVELINCVFNHRI